MRGRGADQKQGRGDGGGLSGIERWISNTGNIYLQSSCVLVNCI